MVFNYLIKMTFFVEFYFNLEIKMSKKEKQKKSTEKKEKLIENKNIATIDSLSIEDDDENIEQINEENDKKNKEYKKDFISNIEEQIDNEEKVETTILSPSKKSHKTFWIVSLSILAILLLFFIFSTIFALITSSKSTIIHGIKIKDIDISGLDRQEAIEKVSEAFNEKLENQVTLTHNNYSITIFPEQFDVSFSIEEAINIAYEKGRNRKYISK